MITAERVRELLHYGPRVLWNLARPDSLIAA
jgi:hypothetical protein